MTNFIYLLGPAGCGKSTLAAALSEDFESHGLRCPIMNLDPGAEWLPYTPEIDIRPQISLSQVMKEYRLGPNGALIVAVDLVVNELPRIGETIAAQNPDYVIVDTPGQMELFAFRETGPAVVGGLSPRGDSIVLFLIDSFLAKRASSFVSMLMLATSVLARFRTPQINLLTKIDAVGREDRERAVSWADRRDLLLDAIEEEPSPLGREAALGLLEAVEKVSFAGELMPVSAADHRGITELVSAIQAVFGKEGELDLGEETEKF
ncbi:MAG: ATP/GTP-binding protein [Candidatus Hadarchaeota archaeon]